MPPGRGTSGPNGKIGCLKAAQGILATSAGALAVVGHPVAAAISPSPAPDTRP
jgi:hypothetical protein